MYEVNKGNSSLGSISMEEEPLLESKRSDGRRDGNQFPTIEETSIINSVSQLRREPVNDPESRLRKLHFKIILFEQGLKSFNVLYLALGIVAAVVYLSRQVVVDVSISNQTWQWVGWIRCASSIMVVILVVCYKVLLWNKSNYIDRKESENSIFFYTFIVITAAISWISYLVAELLNFQYLEYCGVKVDVVLPIVQMLFVMSALVAIPDLAFGRVNVTVPMLFYVVYKCAATLVFVNCVSSLIFDLFARESRYLQYMLSNGSIDIFCKNYSGKQSYVNLERQFGPYLLVFSTIFYVSSIAILIKPIQQFSKVSTKLIEETTTQITMDTDRDLATSPNKEYSSLAIILAIIFCIVGVIGILLDVLGKKSNKDKQNCQIAFVSLPIGIYIVTGALCVYLLKLLHDHYPVKKRKNTNFMYFIIIWISLLFHMIDSFKIIMNNALFLTNPNSTYLGDWKFKLQHSLSIVQFSGAVVQSLLQAMMLDFVNNIDMKHRIKKTVFNQICYPTIIIVSSNLGFFVTCWYLLSGNSSIVSYKNTSNQILWDILSTMSDPFTMIFRGYCILILLQFITKIKCLSNVDAQSN